jgi:uncharacterized membrane protein
MLPPLPPWEGMHPLVVHLPIGLLFLAPLPALIGLFVPGRRHLFAALTFAVTLLGTVAAVVAVLTGEAADEWAESQGLVTPAIHQALEQHEELAETTRTVGLVLTFLFAGIVIAHGKGKLSGAGSTVAHVVLLAGTVTGLILIANTAHLGGQLVHRHGVHAPTAGATAGMPAGGGEVSGEMEDDD